MPNEKKSTPRREKKTGPPRDRPDATPAARRKKSGTDEERSAAPPRERKAAAPASRSRRAESDNERSPSSLREKRSASPASRTKRTDGDSERRASPIRERKAASPASRAKRADRNDERSPAPIRERRPPSSTTARSKKTDEGIEKQTSPPRERRTAPPAARSNKTEGGSERKAPYTRGKKVDTPGDKNLHFPREARRYINVFLGLGSNVGNRRAQIQKAIDLISDHIGKIAKKSHLYETQPWGNLQQERFLNQVVMINTMLDPRDLLKEITNIEAELGRDHRDQEKWGPRTIDVDILFYGKRVVRDKGLEVPHPELHLRSFVLVPLMEIAPDLEHPILKQQIDELYMACEDQSEVIMLDS